MQFLRRPVSPLSVLRGVGIGVVAVAVPSGALGLSVCLSYRGLTAFLVSLGVTYVLIGGVAWAAVRLAHFTPRLVVSLTTFPFSLALLITLPPLLAGNPTPFLMWLALLALAVIAAWAATRLPAPSKDTYPNR